MPSFLVKCHYEKTFTAEIDVELPEDEEELAEFMEEFEEENDLNWKEVNVVYWYSGDEA